MRILDEAENSCDDFWNGSAKYFWRAFSAVSDAES